SLQSIHPRFAGSPINACFVSDLEARIKRWRPTLWLHGHTHDSFDYRIGATRVLANPRGYAPGGVVENALFDPAFHIEIPSGRGATPRTKQRSSTIRNNIATSFTTATRSGGYCATKTGVRCASSRTPRYPPSMAARGMARSSPGPGWTTPAGRAGRGPANAVSAMHTAAGIPHLPHSGP